MNFIERKEKVETHKIMRKLLSEGKRWSFLTMASLKCPEVKPYLAICSNNGNLNAMPEDAQQKARAYGWNFVLRYNRMFPPPPPAQEND